MVMGQTSQSVMAWADGIYWIKCADEVHWTPFEVENRQKLKDKILTQYVFYAYLFKQPGAIFYNAPQVHLPE